MELYFDGASKGNPGKGGCGYVIYENKVEIQSGHECLGECVTNNFAEYMGLIEGLKQSLKISNKTLDVYGDSNLVIKQMNNQWKVSSSNLIPLYKTALDLRNKFEKITFNHVSRNLNKRADELANKSI